MASMIDIKRRKESVTSTQQITKAMKLVSTVKLQKARARAEESKPYFDKMYATVTSILQKSGNIKHPYLTDNGSKKKAVIVVSSNRGLAGGYNNNVAKLLTESNLNKEDVDIYAVGHKAMEVLDRKGYAIIADHSDMIEEPNYGDAMALGKEVLDRYAAGEIGEIYLAYTSFKNTVVHIPKLVKLLPVEFDETYSLILDLVDFKTVLDGCSEDFVTMKFGNGQCVVLVRGQITNIIPEVLERSKE